MAVELIGRTVGWVAIAWTQFPTNMIGSKAVIVTDSIPGGIGLFQLGGKTVQQITPISGTVEGFKVNNVRTHPHSHCHHWPCNCRHAPLAPSHVCTLQSHFHDACSDDVCCIGGTAFETACKLAMAC